MEKKSGTPMWVYLAFSSITTKRGALWLIGLSALFSLYCVPWTVFYPNLEWVATLFLIDGWSWFAVMAASTLWYVIALRWMDKNLAWEE